MLIWGHMGRAGGASAEAGEQKRTQGISRAEPVRRTEGKVRVRLLQFRKDL